MVITSALKYWTHSQTKYTLLRTDTHTDTANEYLGSLDLCSTLLKKPTMESRSLSPDESISVQARYFWPLVFARLKIDPNIGPCLQFGSRDLKATPESENLVPNAESKVRTWNNRARKWQLLTVFYKLFIVYADCCFPVNNVRIYVVCFSWLQKDAKWVIRSNILRFYLKERPHIKV